MNTARGTAPTGIPHDVNPTAGSEYVETDKERCTANAIDKEVSAEHVQGTPEAAPHAITTMVDYMGAAGIETEGDKDALSAFYAALAKIFGRQPEDA